MTLYKYLLKTKHIQVETNKDLNQEKRSMLLAIGDRFRYLASLSLPELEKYVTLEDTGYYGSVVAENGMWVELTREDVLKELME